ncbi:hypothetical protein HPP92_003549 [Vanilla planifolia]|uniref:Uncharacterized protein n=1 Tax=Vanilla planifolia TaxID=51239 RepID=A0A835SGN5_VANPL|nr:hypothetical protein HPP92_003549 [Vanilla planifolia]
MRQRREQRHEWRRLIRCRCFFLRLLWEEDLNARRPFVGCCHAVLGTIVKQLAQVTSLLGGGDKSVGTELATLKVSLSSMRSGWSFMVVMVASVLVDLA